MRSRFKYFKLGIIVEWEHSGDVHVWADGVCICHL